MRDKKIIFLVGPKNPAAKLDNFRDDIYVYLAENLIKEGIVSEAIFVYNDHPLINKKEIKIAPKVRGFFMSSIDQKYLKQKYWGVFVRGNWIEHKEFVKSLDYERSFFYAADNDFLPTQVDAKIFGTIFIDEKYQANIVKKKFPKTKAIIFDKPIKTEIFKPRKCKKVYDLCYVANWRQWKFHNMLFSALLKLNKKGKKLKIALVGKIAPHDRELNIMLYKYKINAHIYEMVDQDKVSDIINKSKFTCQLAEIDANPRSLTESLACGVPVLANKDLSAGIRLINNQTGKKVALSSLDKGIEYMLANYKKYQAYEYFKKNLQVEDIIRRCFN